jgi:hypothetical protein
MFHIMVTGGLTFLCMADEVRGWRKQQPSVAVESPVCQANCSKCDSSSNRVVTGGVTFLCMADEVRDWRKQPDVFVC